MQKTHQKKKGKGERDMFSLASKHNDPNASLAWSERIGYGTGGFAFNMINGIIGSFLTIYFTSTVGLNAGIIATIFAVSKIFDGISDVIVGRMVDRTKSKLGKGRYECVFHLESPRCCCFLYRRTSRKWHSMYIFS